MGEFPETWPNSNAQNIDSIVIGEGRSYFLTYQLYPSQIDIN